MTMLDRMRRHKNWLKWSLGLVCLTFVVFYIPDFLGGGTDMGMAANENVARVADRSITGADFRRRYVKQLEAYRAAYGGNLADDEIRQLQIDQQVLQQMVQENAELAEAERLGVDVSDEEVRARILAIPALQENGGFIGEQRYRDLLRMQRPPVTPGEFEETLRLSMLIEKLRAGLTDWMSMSDKELEKEYARRNEKVKLDIVSIPSTSFMKDVTVTDADVKARFEANTETYRVPDRRKIKYVALDSTAVRAKLNVPQTDVQRYYDDHISSFSTPEQVRASHILLKTEGKKEAEVLAQAEDILKQAKGGADFAELAKKYSEDDSNAQKGGDLDYFGRGRMVPEFEGAAFALQTGQISDVVKSPFGFHIIKVTDKKPGIARTLSDLELYKEIVNVVSFDLADRQIAETADALAREGATPQDLDKAAATRGLKIEESGFFARGGEIDTLGPQPEVVARAFEMADNVTSGSVKTNAGRVIFYVSGKQDSYIPKLEEVSAKVRADLVQARATDLAKKKAEEVAATLQSAPDFLKAAKAAGFEPMTSDPLPRGAVIPGIGRSPEVDAVAFSQPVGRVSGMIATAQGAAIVKVVERQAVTPEAFAAAKDKFREDLLTERRSRFYGAYMDKAKQKMRIEIDPEALKRAAG